jgi:hypothetical protein
MNGKTIIDNYTIYCVIVLEDKDGYRRQFVKDGACY